MGIIINIIRGSINRSDMNFASSGSINFFSLSFFKITILMDEVMRPRVTIKVVWHQWYWFYEYSAYDPETIEFDSYMIPTYDLKEGEQRLLEVDNRVKNPVRLLVTGDGVLHSFTVPSLSLKVDAIPG